MIIIMFIIVSGCLTAFFAWNHKKYAKKNFSPVTASFAGRKNKRDKKKHKYRKRISNIHDNISHPDTDRKNTSQLAHLER